MLTRVEQGMLEAAGLARNITSNSSSLGRRKMYTQLRQSRFSNAVDKAGWHCLKAEAERKEGFGEGG